jgi:hypothetical protein
VLLVRKPLHAPWIAWTDTSSGHLACLLLGQRGYSFDLAGKTLEGIEHQAGDAARRLSAIGGGWPGAATERAREAAQVIDGVDRQLRSLIGQSRITWSLVEEQ